VFSFPVILLADWIWADPLLKKRDLINPVLFFAIDLTHVIRYLLNKNWSTGNLEGLTMHARALNTDWRTHGMEQLSHRPRKSSSTCSWHGTPLDYYVPCSSFVPGASLSSWPVHCVDPLTRCHDRMWGPWVASGRPLANLCFIYIYIY
jgi:hypothetical protein